MHINTLLHSYSFMSPIIFRMNVFTNFWFLINVLCLMVIVTWLALYPCTKIAEIMELIDLAEDGFHHMNFRYFLMLFPIGQFIVAGAIEVSILLCIGFSFK